MLFLGLNEVDRPKGLLRRLTAPANLTAYSKELKEFLYLSRGDYKSRRLSGDEASFDSVAGSNIKTQAFRGWRWIWEAERTDEFKDHPLNTVAPGMKAVILDGQIIHVPDDWPDDLLDDESEDEGIPSRYGSHQG